LSFNPSERFSLFTFAPIFYKPLIFNSIIVRKLSILLFISVLGLSLKAQVNDSVSVGPGYTNQTFYSLSKGTISSISNTDWDLAFHADRREVSILINSKNGVKLYLASSDTTKWTSVDTAGKISAALQLHNSDSNWSNGAFNRVPNGTFNYGWGTYDQTTHVVFANNIYFISYSDGATTVWKKLIISKASIDYKYYFRFANLDGSSETSVVIDKNNYPKRNFIYYSLKNAQVLDREPDNTTYDLIFCQYEQEVPFYYPVTGALLNIGVKAKYVYPVDKNMADFHNYTLVKNISEIGGGWKIFNFSTNAYDMKDSAVYFIQDVNGKIWKMIFTGFGGAATGKIYFNKTNVGTNGISTNASAIAGIYPNPANSSTSLVFTGVAGEAKVTVLDLTGKEVMNSVITANNGLNQVSLNTNELNNGTYIVRLETADGVSSSRLTVQR
jgi:hypothetical protein